MVEEKGAKKTQHIIKRSRASIMGKMKNPDSPFKAKTKLNGQAFERYLLKFFGSKEKEKKREGAPTDKLLAAVNFKSPKHDILQAVTNMPAIKARFEAFLAKTKLNGQAFERYLLKFFGSKEKEKKREGAPTDKLLAAVNFKSPKHDILQAVTNMPAIKVFSSTLAESDFFIGKI
eukprot:TRINITY_DN3258_c0_g2_i1.p2 TRINITY_DN3258_c0_g2~~TRINITY_DN3258_c0_g2_i1.p2  ORF type:complete len:175 (-),score=40.67 TRINITY_DN3258_c0_g2_i1:11-535(-)